MTVILFVSTKQNCVGQEGYLFDTSSEYLDYAQKEYSIDRNNVYYVSDSTKKAVLNYPSFVFFIQSDKIITIEQISNKLNTQCPPKKLIKKLSYDLIESYFEGLEEKEHLVLKNMISGVVKTDDSKITAVFFFSIHLGKKGLKYINQIKKINALDFETIILSFDTPNIRDIEDYSKLNLIKIKTTKI